eukprot:92400-Hanusia_phi.AAC.1
MAPVTRSDTARVAPSHWQAVTAGATVAALTGSRSLTREQAARRPGRADPGLRPCPIRRGPYRGTRADGRSHTQ